MTHQRRQFFLNLSETLKFATEYQYQNLLIRLFWFNHDKLLLIVIDNI